MIICISETIICDCLFASIMTKISRKVFRWDWVAFLFPELYIIFHRFQRDTLPWLFVICCLFFLPLVWLLNLAGIQGPNYFFVLDIMLIRLLFMFLCGRNARTTEWYEEKWESVTYFNKISKTNNIKTLSFVVGFFVLLFFI